MKCAPIIIPTLNRFDHLKKCIKSLEKNSLARESELYISVDFPVSKEQILNRSKIIEYINNEINGFRSVNIFIQDKNLGPYNNMEFLIEMVYEKYDRYIFTEDDIEYSCNFLEFMNKGLNLFENDEDIIAICSCGAPKMNMKNNNFVKTQNFTAQGMGIWKHKEKEYKQKICRKYFENIAENYSEILKLLKYDYSLFFSFISVLLKREKVYIKQDEEVACVDMTIKIYMQIENKFVICPVVPLSQNNGYDGSGVNCPKVLNLDVMEKIDLNEHFEYIMKSKIEIKQIVKKLSLNILIRILHGFAKIICYKAGKKITVKLVALYWKIKCRIFRFVKVDFIKLKILLKRRSENPHIAFLIIYREDPIVGLCSCLATYLNCCMFADEKNLIPVIDMCHFKNSLLSEEQLNLINSFEYYFEQPGEFKLKEALMSRNIIFQEALKLKVEKNYIISDADFKFAWEKYFRFNKKTNDFFVETYKNINMGNERIIGVLARGTDYKLDGLPVNMEEVYKKIKNIKKEYNCSKVFVATEDEQILFRMKKEFKSSLLYLDDVRTTLEKNRFLAQRWEEMKIDKYKKNLLYLASLYILSKSDCLICNHDTSARPFVIAMKDGEYEYSYTFNLT